jgi:hypothetical protein
MDFIFSSNEYKTQMLMFLIKTCLCECEHWDFGVSVYGYTSSFPTSILKWGNLNLHILLTNEVSKDF